MGQWRIKSEWIITSLACVNVNFTISEFFFRNSLGLGDHYNAPIRTFELRKKIKGINDARGGYFSY